MSQSFTRTDIIVTILLLLLLGLVVGYDVMVSIVAQIKGGNL